MAASVPDFPTSLAYAGKMPAPLEAGASRIPSSRSPICVYGSWHGWGEGEVNGKDLLSSKLARGTAAASCAQSTVRSVWYPP